MFKTFHGKYVNKNISIDKMHESPMVMLIPLLILAIGAIFSGYLFKEILISETSKISFWKESILFLSEVNHDHIPLWLLIITPTLVLIPIPISYYLFTDQGLTPASKKFLNGIVERNKPVYNFLLNKWYFDEIYDFIFVKPIKKIGLLFWKQGDIKTIDRFGPDGLAKLIKYFSTLAVKFQNGFVYHYAFVMLLGFSALLTFLILK